MSGCLGFCLPRPTPRAVGSVHGHLSAALQVVPTTPRGLADCPAPFPVLLCCPSQNPPPD